MFAQMGLQFPRLRERSFAIKKWANEVLVDVSESFTHVAVYLTLMMICLFDNVYSVCFRTNIGRTFTWPTSTKRLVQLYPERNKLLSHESGESMRQIIKLYQWTTLCAYTNGPIISPCFRPILNILTTSKKTVYF